MASPKTLAWRLRHQLHIYAWQSKLQEVRQRSFGEHWDLDRYEMEVMQLIENQDMRDVFRYAKNYVARYKKGRFFKLMNDIYNEIIKFGVVEPGRLKAIHKLIYGRGRR